MKRIFLSALGLGLAGGGLALFTFVTARRIDRALPPPGRFIEADGVRIHFTDEGSGPPIVMIHGLAGNLRNFTHSLVDLLRGDFRVIAIDRPGSGNSTRPTGASPRLTAQARTVAATIKALGIERPLLVGHSLGGTLALATALDHPHAVGGLALLAPLTIPTDILPAPFRLMAIRSPLLRRLVAWTVAVPSAILRRNTTLAMLFGPDPVPPDFATRGGSLLGLRPQSFQTASADLMAINDDLPGLAARYGSIAVPAGILFGEGDQIVDYRINGEALVERIPGLDLELIEGGGHMTPITAPDRAAAFIRRLASRIGA